MSLLNWNVLRPRWLAVDLDLGSRWPEAGAMLDTVTRYDYSVTMPMTDMPGPNETRLNLIDGVEYFTVRADDFRDAMRIRDDLQAKAARQRRALVQIENWVGKEYADLDEAEVIRLYIQQQCEGQLGQP